MATGTTTPAVLSASAVPVWQNALLLCGAFLIILFIVLCVVATFRSRRRQRREEEHLPLLNDELETDSERFGCGSSSTINNRSRQDMAAIGTPARDFVRLSSLPASVFKDSDDGRRCMACSQPGDCVALRPCGHAVLCRACSDFVYTCPYCGQYISGVAQPAPKDPNHSSNGLRPRCS